MTIRLPQKDVWLLKCISEKVLSLDPRVYLLITTSRFNTARMRTCLDAMRSCAAPIIWKKKAAFAVFGVTGILLALHGFANIYVETRGACFGKRWMICWQRYRLVFRIGVCINWR